MENTNIAFTITNWRQVQAKFLLDRWRDDDVLYPLIQTEENEAPAAASQIIVERVVQRVMQAASSWSKEAAKHYQKGIDALSFNFSDIRSYQDFTNLSIVARAPGIPHDFVTEMESLLRNGFNQLGNSSVFTSNKTGIEINLADKLNLTNLPSRLSPAKITLLNLRNISLFHIPDSICAQQDMTQLCLSNTKLRTLIRPSEYRSHTNLPENLTHLDISDNPDLTNIDAIKTLWKLTRLDISGTGVTSLPAEIWENKNITVVMSEDMKKTFQFEANRPDVKFQYSEARSNKPASFEQTTAKVNSTSKKSFKIWIGVLLAGLAIVTALVWRRWARP